MALFLARCRILPTHRTGCLLLCLSSSLPAAAQTIDDQEVPVLASPMQNVAAPEALVGASVGGQAGILFRDNIYRSHDDRQSDLISYAAPAFSVKAGNDRYTGRLTGQVEGGAYADNPNNDYIDANLDGRGRYSLTESTALTAQGQIRRDHVEVGAFVDDPGQRANNPTIYDLYSGGVGVESYQGADDQVFLSGKSDFRDYNYSNVDRVGGGRIVNDDRDHNEWENTGRLGYVVAPGWMPYAEGGYNIRHYDKRIDDTLLYTRDSDGYDGLLGVQYGKTGDPLTVDAAAGYLWQNYDDDLLPDIHTWKIRGSAIWQARPWLIFHGDLDRSAEENTLRGSSGYVKTRVGVGGQYYFEPRWLVATDLHYTNYDFHINPGLSGNPDREDDVYDASLLVQYDITERYNVGLQYLYAKRDSNNQLFRFDSNSVLLKLAAAF